MADTPSYTGATEVAQIALVVADIEAAAAAWAKVLGVEKPNVITTDPEPGSVRYQGEGTAARAKLAFFHFKNITLELIEPLGEPSAWADGLKESNGGGFHHIAFRVDEMASAVEESEANGLETVQVGPTGDQGKYAYLKTAPTLGGVFIELLSKK